MGGKEGEKRAARLLEDGEEGRLLLGPNISPRRRLAIAARVVPQGLALRSFAFVRSILHHLITTSSYPWRTRPCPEPRARSKSASSSARHAAAQSRNASCPRARNRPLHHCSKHTPAEGASRGAPYAC